jgi:hypothetical protein
VEWHPVLGSNGPVLLTMTLAFHVGVEVLVDVPNVLGVRDLDLERLYGLVTPPEHTLSAAKDIAKRVGEEHHVYLGVFELGAQDPVCLPFHCLIPKECPSGPVAVVFTHTHHVLTRSSRHPHLNMCEVAPGVRAPTSGWYDAGRHVVLERADHDECAFQRPGPSWEVSETSADVLTAS